MATGTVTTTWVQIKEGEIINIDQKVVRVLKENRPLNATQDSGGGIGYYIGFYESLDDNQKSNMRLKFNTPSDRDDAFDIILTALQTIDIRK
jgi:hypothetical protein